MLARPLLPLARATESRVTALAVSTSLLLNVPVPVAVTVSPVTRPEAMARVAVALVLPS
ncbi:hypothetical protein D3C85_1810100 [compost metagenome]